MGSQTSRHHAGYSFILDSLEGDRTIMAYKGANNELGFREIDLNKLKAKWLYCSSMMGKSYETLEKLAGYASENNIKVGFNPSNYLAEKGALYLKDLLACVHLLILNKEEASLIAGSHEIKELIVELMRFGPNLVVVTDGKSGAYTISNGYLFHVMPRDITPVETTGAGDAFASTFLAGHIRGESIETSLRMCTRNAESVILHQGAKKGLLGMEELMRSIKKSQPKLKKEKV